MMYRHFSKLLFAVLCGLFFTMETKAQTPYIYSNSPICEDNMLELFCQNAPVGATFDWSGPNGMTATTQNVQLKNATIFMSGTYTLKISHNGITDVLTTNVIINPNPDIKVTPPIANLCNGDTIVLTASGADTYVWSTGETTPSITITPSSATSYTVIGGTNDGCISMTTVISRSSENIDYYLPTEICEGTPITVIPANPTSSYVWDDGEVGYTINPSVSTSTLLTVTVTDTNGCVGNASVTVHPSPTAGFSADNTTLEIAGGIAIINFTDESKDALMWSWDFADYTSPWNSSNEQSPSFSYTHSGFYNVTQTVTTDHNCRDSVSHVIRITSPFTFFVPNAFTPGRLDGMNDVFQPAGEGISPDNYEMLIYNKWGEIIYRTTEALGSWDGYYKGKIAQAGVYAYRITLFDMDEDEKIFVGTVTLVR